MWYRYWRPATELANPECVLNPDPNFPKRSLVREKKTGNCQWNDVISPL